MEPYIEFIGTLQNSGFWLAKQMLASAPAVSFTGQRNPTKSFRQAVSTYVWAAWELQRISRLLVEMPSNGPKGPST